MPINGGGGSSCRMYSMRGETGPIKTILIGNITVDTALFHSIGESPPVLRTESGSWGKPRGPVVPKSEVEMNRKANPETRKRIMNVVLEMFMLRV